MAGKNTAAFGLYKSRAQAESAVDALQQAGFRSDDISVLLPDQQSSEEFAHEKNTKRRKVQPRASPLVGQSAGH